MSISEILASMPTELTDKLTNFIEAELNQAIASRGVALLVVSGGNTPKPLFEALSQKTLPWDKVIVTLADERWVDLDSDASNEAMVRNMLLQGPAAKAKFIPLKNSAKTASEGQNICQKTLASLPEIFDVVILGMGDDGHTASLFPGVSGQALNSDAKHLCQSIIPPVAPHERMTLTARALLNSRRVILHIVGDKKWQVYQKAQQEGAIDELPVRVILQQDKVPVDVYWSP